MIASIKRRFLIVLPVLQNKQIFRVNTVDAGLLPTGNLKQKHLVDKASRAYQRTGKFCVSDYFQKRDIKGLLLASDTASQYPKGQSRQGYMVEAVRWIHVRQFGCRCESAGSGRGSRGESIYSLGQNKIRFQVANNN